MTQADAQADQRIALAAAFQLAQGGQGQAGTGGAERVANGDGAAVGVQARVIKGDAELLAAAQYLGGKGLVDLDDVHVVQAQPGAAESFLAGFNRTQTHDAGGNAGDSTAENPCPGLERILLANGFATDQQRSGTVIDAGCITGGDHAVGKQRTQAGKGSQITLWARVLVLINQSGRLLAALTDFDRQDFIGKEAFTARLFIQRLAAGGIGVSLFTADTQFGGDVVCRLRHGVVTEGLFYLGVGKARTNGAVKGAEVARIGAFTLGDDKGCAAHAFHTAGNEELAFTALDCP